MGELEPQIVFWQPIANRDDPTMFEAHAAHGNWRQHKVSAGLTETPSSYAFLQSILVMLYYNILVLDCKN